MILFLVRVPKSEINDVPRYVVVWADDRETAKDAAVPHLSRLYGDKDTWDVLPLTEPEAKVTIAAINLN